MKHVIPERNNWGLRIDVWQLAWTDWDFKICA